MAGQNELLIKLRADNSQLRKDFTLAQKTIKQQGAMIEKSAMKASEGISKVGQSSGLAGAAVMALGGGLSDMQYGLRGVANNAQQFVAMFGMLTKSAGGFAGAMKALRGAMLGPMGIVIGLQTLISVLGIFQERQRKAKREAEKAKVASEGLKDAMEAERKKRIDLNESLSEQRDLQKEINNLSRADLLQKRAEAQSRLADSANLLAIAQENVDGAYERFIQFGGRARGEYDAQLKVLGELQQERKADLQVIDAVNKAMQAMTKITKDETDAIKEQYRASSELLALKVKMGMLQGGIVAPEPIEMPGLSFDWVREGAEEATKSVDRLSDSVTSLASQAMVGLAESIGQAFGGNEITSIGDKILSVIAEFVGTLGKLLVAAGMAMSGFQAALASFNPFLMIGAGIAAIAAASAIKAHVKKGATSGGSMAAPNPTYGGGSMNPEIRVRGEDLYITLERVRQRKGRTR